MAEKMKAEKIAVTCWRCGKVRKVAHDEAIAISDVENVERECPKCRAKREALEPYKAELREMLPPGSTVFCILRHVSRSGMFRRISLVVPGKDGGFLHLDHLAARVAGWTLSAKHEGINVGGCGMDMGFHLVYSLSRVLYPDGFGLACREDGCTFRPRTKDEARACNNNLSPGVTPHKFWGRNADVSGWDNDGGYALNYRWL